MLVSYAVDVRVFAYGFVTVVENANGFYLFCAKSLIVFCFNVYIAFVHIIRVHVSVFLDALIAIVIAIVMVSAQLQLIHTHTFLGKTLAKAST